AAGVNESAQHRCGIWGPGGPRDADDPWCAHAPTVPAAPSAPTTAPWVSRARGASLRAPQSRAKPSIEREERACEPRSREQSRVSSARSELASPAVASKAEYRARGASLRAPQSRAKPSIEREERACEPRSAITNRARVTRAQPLTRGPFTASGVKKGPLHVSAAGGRRPRRRTARCRRTRWR